ncbi:hypothetical protein H2198_001907 [Neophaeococcomyces mojaviensis]|uniref:Uncharacterized protein n=1 Tax=Neophaeococcomyces mojaviensis TaxID=3383035 RepID=A0ACC3AFM1_9EURO|nr:hypothetical protein H2198_001907 [Knufia sp. JES_112]
MPLTSTNKQTPTNYVVVLYPCHQLLDSAGPLDILSTITKRPEGANITLTVAAETLEPVPLAPVPPAGVDWEFEDVAELPKAEDGEVGGAGFDVEIRPSVTFEELLKSLRGRNDGMFEMVDGRGRKVVRSVDVLLIPGGIGTRMFRVPKGGKGEGGVGERWNNVEGAVKFVKELCEGQWVQSAVLTVCTGSDLLARTGLLDGRRATTNVMAFEKVAERNKGVQWQRLRRWVRSLPEEVKGDGKKGFEKEIWTSAGISAGMDLMLWFVAEIYGKEFAHGIARRLEYEWRSHIEEGEVDPYYT